MFERAHSHNNPTTLASEFATMHTSEQKLCPQKAIIEKLSLFILILDLHCYLLTYYYDSGLCDVIIVCTCGQFRDMTKNNVTSQTKKSDQH